VKKTSASLNTHLALLVPLPEGRGEVCRLEISHNPLPLLLECLLGEGESSQLPSSPSADLSKVRIQDGQGAAVIIAANTSHILTHFFFIFLSSSLGTNLTRFLGEV
jgi:hypothetical protein